ncbi:aromatic ring-hydroxylating oxygenase subunit alpha [Aquimarina aquimarini]|uniref:aromatic ring-hydroxylating oxygenase subunit alpha n=1 Tax=Aquimarina aquimarini TaxID=1191734 RepID=UPI000D55E3E9|nr:aromatic ring-hydroxylating dioxygenase subunit alpha [Aquimarina aquimarini]
MNRELEISILKRIIENVNSRKVSDTGNQSEYSKISVEAYTSREKFIKEKNTLFKEFPLMVGFSSEIANHGDYIAHDLTTTPIIVIRNKDMSLKAYINACRHRGARMLDEVQGNCKGNLKCPFHGWSYSPKNGDLRGLPNPEGFPCINKKDFGLISLPVEECFGMIYVIPTPGKELDLKSHLGEIYDNLMSYGYDENKVLYKSKIHHRDMNWKFSIEANSENYHFPYLHKESSADNFLSFGSVFDYLKPHARLIAPQEKILKEYDKDEKDWELQNNVTIIYFIFPNTFYLTGTGFGHVLSVYPKDEKHCTFISGTLVDDLPHTEKNKMFWEQQYNYYWGALYEDMEIGESIQTTIESEANTHFVYGTYEDLLYKFHKTVEEVINGEYSLEDVKNNIHESLTV